jgi:hypothetical protein
MSRTGERGSGVPVGRIGRVMSGVDAGFLVEAVDDTAETGGFYVFLWSPSTGFDEEVKSWEGVVERLDSMAVDWSSEFDNARATAPERQTA